MPRSPMLAAPIAVALIAAAFAAPVVAQDEEVPLGPPQATPNPVALDTPAGDGTGIRLTTDLGDIVIGLFNESAPVASENFQNLVEAGYYDGLGFHRVAEDFVIQGGDPNGDGSGGPGYTITDEEVVGEYGRGIVAMARTRAPDSQGSQFFVVLDDSAEAALEAFRTYVIFGRVLEGMDVVDAIVTRGPAADIVEDSVKIQKATVEPVELPPEPTPAPPTEGELAAAALGDELPDEVAGRMFEQSIFTADQILSASDQDEAIGALTKVAADNGGAVTNLSVATAAVDDGEVFAIVLAGSIPGVEAELYIEPMAELILGGLPDEGPEDAVVAGRDVQRVVPYPDAPEEEYIYLVPNGDVLWFVVADTENLEEIVSSLP